LPAVVGDAEVAGAGHFQARVTAGVDRAEGFQRDIHVQREAMVTAAVADAQSQGGNLCRADINAGRIGAPSAATP
jgi:hypothetical protein